MTPRNATDDICDVLILTMLVEEFNAVRDRMLLDPNPLSTLDSSPRVSGTIANLRVVLIKMTMGGGEAQTNPQVAAAATRMIDQHSPIWVFLVGVAGGIAKNGVGLGDVVIPTRSYGAYAKIATGMDEASGSAKVVFERRSTFDATTSYFVNNWLQIDDTFSAGMSLKERWVQGIRASVPAGENGSDLSQLKLHFGSNVLVARDDTGYTPPALLSTDFLIDSLEHQVVKDLLDDCPDALAIEMEAIGVAAALTANRTPGTTFEFVVVRGICDLPGEEGRTGRAVRDAWKPFAAAAAAAAVETILTLQSADFRRRFPAGAGVQTDTLPVVVPTSSDWSKATPSLLDIPRDSTIESMGFVGRASELGQLDAWYDTSRTPIAAIVGFPEIGKSSLIRQWNYDRGGLTRTIDVRDGESYCDASRNNEDQLADWLLGQFCGLFGIDQAEEEKYEIQLAELMRKQPIVWVIDQMELLLQDKTPMDVRQEQKVGKTNPRISRFIHAFRTASGEGRLILVSSYRPKDVVDKRLIDSGIVQLIQTPVEGKYEELASLRGLTHLDAQALMIREMDGLPTLNDDQISTAITTFEGHPMALRWFAHLESDKQVEILAGDLRLLVRTLNRLLSVVIAERCEPDEIALLKRLACASRPEQLDILQAVCRPSIFTQEWDLLDLVVRLENRYFVEHNEGSETYRIHSLVRQWVHEFGFADGPVVEDIHRTYGEVYAGRAEAAAHDRPRLDSTRLAMHHFSFANDESEFLHWRQRYVSLSFESGRMAYLGGQYQDAHIASDTFIRTMESLPPDRRSPLPLSRAYMNRAVSQFRLDPVNKSIYSDLECSMALWSGNAHALNFAGSILRRTVRQRQGNVQWVDLELTMHNIIDRVDEEYGQSSYVGQPDTLIGMIALIASLMRTFPNREASDGYALRLVTLLGYLGADGTAHVRLRERDYETWLQALLRIGQYRGFSRSLLTDHDISSHLSDAARIADHAVQRYPHSAKLILLSARIACVRARVATDRAEALSLLERGQASIDHILAEFFLPWGTAFTWADLVGEYGRRLDREAAIALYAETESRLASMLIREEDMLSPIEVSTARVRLLRYLTEMEQPGNREIYHNQAYDLVSAAFSKPETLTPEMADLAIRVLLEDTEFDQELKTAYDQQSTRAYFDQFDHVLDQANAIYPSEEYHVLKLKHRLLWCRAKTITNSSHRPLPDSVELAEAIVRDYPHYGWALVVVAEFWGYVGRIADSEEAYEDAYRRGVNALDMLMTAPTPPRSATYVLARFHRWLPDAGYYTARRILREHTQDAELSGMTLLERERWSRLYVDTVAHAADRPDPDNIELRGDAERALALQESYFTIIGLSIDELIRNAASFTDELDDVRRAQEVLWRVRCLMFLGSIDIGALSWIPELVRNLNLLDIEPVYSSVSSELSINGEERDRTPLVMENVQEITKLHNSSEPVGKILALHAGNPVIWREIGTLIANSRVDNAAEWSQKFWDIAARLAANKHWKSREFESSEAVKELIRLNSARGLVLHGKKAESEWKRGYSILNELITSSSLPWVYRRFALDLVEQFA